MRTAGSPQGELTLHARFDDVGELVVGHAVQIADVPVGTVTDVELDGHRALVTLSIEDGVEVPAGTSAQVAKTSLLGENYVALVLPEGGGPPLPDDAELTDTSTAPEFEQLTAQATEVLGALVADDLAAVVDAGAEGLGGRGEQLGTLLTQLRDVVGTYAAQRDEIARAIDGFAALGGSLADGSATIDASLTRIAEATATMAADRERLVSTVEALTRMASQTNDVVLEPHADELAALLERLGPIVAELAGQRDTLESFIHSQLLFITRIDDNIVDGQQMQYVWGGGRVPSASHDVFTLLTPTGAAP
jgi:phospholipid/cholesterol/gamma-HCH transport system substrate-binding protein